MFKIQYIKFGLFILGLFIFIACGGNNSSSQSGNRPFITTWKTDNSGKTEDNQIEISTNPNYTYNFTVDWGDGNISTKITESIVHTYPKAGVYTVKIMGEYPRIWFMDDGGRYSRDDREKLVSVEQWGDIKWKSMEKAFQDCEKLVINAKDIPDLSLVSNMSYMFHNVKSNFNQTIGNWDVSHVTNMSYMFAGASNFNQTIENWDTSSVVDMSSMFMEATAFNGKINKWNVSNVTHLEGMFERAINFNQTIGNWDVSHVTSMSGMFRGASNFNQAIENWDTSSVVNMSMMFADAITFNQNIGTWDVSSVRYMEAMFTRAKVFNQNLATWDTSSVSSMYDMFMDAVSFNQNLETWDVTSILSANSLGADNGMDHMFRGVTLSTENYDAILQSWSQQSVHKNIYFDGGNSKYSQASMEAREKLINEYQWRITDGGMQ